MTALAPKKPRGRRTFHVKQVSQPKPRLARRARSAFDVGAHETLVISRVNKRLSMMGLGRVKKAKVGVVGHDLGRELHQEGMIALHRAGKSYRPGKAKFSTLAVRHIDGAIGRALKRQGPVAIGERAVRKRLKAGVALPGMASLADVDREEQTSGGLRRVEARARLRSGMKGLSLRHRQILKASLTESQAKIAKRMGMSKANVNKLLAQAKAHVRKREGGRS